MKRGAIVYLSAVEQKDLKELMKWRNLEDFKKYFREYRELNLDMQKKWYQSKVLNDPSTIMLTIRRVSDDVLLGCCGLCYINWIERHADLSLYIGYKESYIDEEGYAQEGLRILLDYAFNELNLNKIWTEIYEFDQEKNKLYELYGFKQDGILREHYYYDGRFWNSFLLSLLKREFVHNR